MVSEMSPPYHQWFFNFLSNFILDLYFDILCACEILGTKVYVHARHCLAVNLKNPELNLVIDPRLTPPTESQLLELRKIVTVGLADHVARFVCVL